MNKLSLVLASLFVSFSAFAATTTGAVTYDTAAVVGTITNLTVAATAIIGAGIVFGLTRMFLRKIRGLASRG